MQYVEINAMQTNEFGQAIGFPVEAWNGATVPSRTSLDGTAVRMVCATDTSACQALFDAYVKDTDGANWTYLPYGPFARVSDFTRWFEATCLADDPLFHVVYDKSTNKAIGLASLLRINPVAGSIEVGHIHFSPTLQRTPMSTEAMYLLMKRIFDELGYRRYEWKCDALNEPSKNAAQRLGFTFEGIFRQAVIYKNRNRDTAWFSITDKEWPALKAGFESWLHSDNFDRQGQQIKTLAQCRAI